MEEYRITKEICQEMIGDLVCPCCGKQSLEPIETVDNADNPTYWAGCNDCGQYSWGVRNETYIISNKLVREHNYVAYQHLGSNYELKNEELDRWFKSQISGTHPLVYSFLKIQKELSDEKDSTTI